MIIFCSQFPYIPARLHVKIVRMGHFIVVYLVAKLLIWSEAEGDHIVIETSI